MPDFSRIHNPKSAGNAAEDNETSCNCLAFQGTMKIHESNRNNATVTDITGNGHHGIDFIGAASVRAGKGLMYGSNNQAAMTRIM